MDEVRKYSTTVPLSFEVATWFDGFRSALAAMRRRTLEPWTFSDGWRGWPVFTPFPTVERVLRGWRRYQTVVDAALGRIRDAWAVLTGQISLDDEDDW